MNEKNNVGKLISITYRNSEIFFKNTMFPLKLPGCNHSILFALYNHNNIRHDDLAKLLCVDKATVTRAVHKLAEAGLVERIQDESDRRVYHLHMTEKAFDMEPKVIDMIGAWSDRLFDGFTEDEIEQALSYLTRISDNSILHRDKPHQSL